MPRPFSALRGKIHEYGMTQVDIARRLKLSVNSVSARFSNKEPWHLDEMYELLDMIGEPARKIGYYFPKGGRNE